MHKFDLVDEMQWEDLVEWVSLEDAGLEDSPVWDTVCAAQLQYFRDEQ